MKIEYPLSGPVSQWFELLAKYMSQQTGFININNVVSSDPETEKKIIEETAGYGKQLGWIIEALSLVMRKVELDKLPSDLSDEDRKVVVRLIDLADKIEQVKKQKEE
jgi:hypothetical protein